MTSTLTAPAVLYICCSQPYQPGDGEKRAREEARAFAADRAIQIIAEISDPYGEANPADRAGWRQVQEMAQAGRIQYVLARWASTVTPDHERRYWAAEALKRHGVRVRYYWPTATQEAKRVIRW